MAVITASASAKSPGQLPPRPGLAAVAKSQSLSAREGAIDAAHLRGAMLVQRLNREFGGLSGSHHQDASRRQVPQFLLEQGHRRMADGGASLLISVSDRALFPA